MTKKTAKKCIVITGLIEDFGGWLADAAKDAYVICADGGYAFAKVADIKVDLLVGDFDSYDGELPDEDLVEIIRLEVEKDDTDTGICIREAIERGYRHIVIAGGIGGRLSHTISNIQTMASAAGKVDLIEQIDGNRHSYMLKGPATLRVPKRMETFDGHEKKKPFISLFAHGGDCTGVDISGVYYPLEDGALTSFYPLGCSNEIVDDEAVISVKKGNLLVIEE